MYGKISYMNPVLPQEMQKHTYAIMDRVEDSHWWFVGRRAILESFLDTITSGQSRPPAATRILDVGCGTGANLEMLAKFGCAEGVDVSDDALTFCQRKGLNVRKGSAENLPFDENTFDITTALDVIEHLDDDISGLKEMFRVTKPGGYALIFVPAFMWLWGVQDDISHHRIRYTRGQISARVRQAGFSIERATYANFTFFLPVLAGRFVMRLTGIRPASENNINVPALNGFFGRIFAAERHWLRRFDFPFGVSIVIVARKPAA